MVGLPNVSTLFSWERCCQQYFIRRVDRVQAHRPSVLFIHSTTLTLFNQHNPKRHDTSESSSAPNNANESHALSRPE